jgi:GT2 family glycosyltransferase
VAKDPFDALMFGGGAPGASVIEGTVAPIGIVEFCEQAYLEAYPALKPAIADGTLPSALYHYLRNGAKEGRLSNPEYIRHLAGNVEELPAHGAMSFSVDVAIASGSGTLFVVGWTDDRETALTSISAIQGAEGWNTRGLARCRRVDVDEVLQSQTGHSHGFWFVHRLGKFNPQAGMMLRARFADGRFTQMDIKPRIVTNIDLREIILGHFASLQYAGNRDIEAVQELSHGAGDELLLLNRSISDTITKTAHAEYYGPRDRRFKASYIVCLFGKIEYFFLQNALFYSGSGAEDVEFIYVSNSPELADPLQKEARIAEQVYGLSLILVTLSGNAGFGAANNAAARFARSDRLVIINPDVFPQENDWAIRHEQVLLTKPARQTKIFGAPLYYDDGSLMHGGMYFDIDRGLSVKASGTKVSKIIRVEHYGKGAPQGSSRYTTERAVPAVTGAFISIERSWFEELGGFTEDYVFGHYEDADLCLKSLIRGVPVWLLDIRFWHLEGKGSVRRPPHEGGSLVNRWLFTRTWGSVIEETLVGRHPAHPLLAVPDVSTTGNNTVAMVNVPADASGITAEIMASEADENAI